MRNPACVVCWLVVIVVSAAGAGRDASAASLAQRLDTIFAPTRVEQATLARDGKHLAFALRDERALQLLIYGVDLAERPALVRLDRSESAPVPYLRWIAPDRLVTVVGASVVLVFDAHARVVHQLEGAKAFTAPGEKRSGRFVVRVPDGGEQLDTVVVEVLWLETDGTVVLDLLDVNVRTGDRRLGATRGLEAPGGAWLLDRQGRPRVLCSFAGLQRRFFHVPLEGATQPEQPFDRLVRGVAASAWQVTPRNIAAERAFPLAFDRDPNVLYLASNVDRDTFGLYALDVRTGEPTSFALADAARDLADFLTPMADSGLVFDRARQTLAGFTPPWGTAVPRWFDADLAAVQEVIEGNFPGREVRVLEWDDARERFLVMIRSSTDAGRTFVFHRRDRRCVEYQRNAALPVAEANRVEPFTGVTSAGEPISATMIWPTVTTTLKPALVVWLHDVFVPATPSSVAREAQALAAAGFAVAEINYRGSAGSGRKQREMLRAAFDRAPLDDVVAVVAALTAAGRIDPARVAIAGEGFGGYVALRALQLEPERFRAAVAINAPLDLARLYEVERDGAADRRMAEQRLQAGRQGSLDLLADAGDDPSLGLSGLEGASGSAGGPLPGGGGGGPRPVGPVNFEREFARWFFGPAGRQKIAVTRDLDLFSRPVLMMHDPRLAFPAIGPMRRLRDALVRRKQPFELVELSPAFGRGSPEARAAVFRQIGEFLTTQCADVSATSETVPLR